ncbi:hypothetical protein [Tahibacter caeni]|uniref:hypothetical protein n=1 Tax=Tahibacter caeni TaxID=1453545 RepID=UPI0021474457|nr:hypothetical protein [Tahibacter caeni]
MHLRLRSLSLCLLAAGAVAPAQAVYVNPNGTGQALIYPYYTVNAGQQTVLSLTNTTDRVKVVQVNFREAYNGRLVLRFDVVLGAHDAWNATVAESPGGTAGIPVLALRDDSCTVPQLAYWTNPGGGGGPWQELLPYDYTGNNADGGPTAYARLREGYFELVERAELVGDLAAAANQRNCIRFEDPNAIPSNGGVRAPGGGLRGSFAIVNVAEGTILGGNATALDGFSTTPLYRSGQEPLLFDTFASPNAGSNDVSAQVPVNGRMLNLLFPANRKVDAISAVLMTDRLLGDVTREPNVGSNSEWVVAAPTKRFHTDAARQLTQLAPFTSYFNTQHAQASCAGFAAALHDRDGRAIALNYDPAGSPPANQPPPAALCHAVDVLSFAPTAAATPVLGSTFGKTLGAPSPAAEAGSLELTLGLTGQVRSYLPAGTTGPGLVGLPVVGFEAVKYVNANAAPGMLANYTLARPLGATAGCANAAGAAAACP